MPDSGVKRRAREVSEKIERARSQLNDGDFEAFLELIRCDLKVWESTLDRFTVVEEPAEVG